MRSAVFCSEPVFVSYVSTAFAFVLRSVSGSASVRSAEVCRYPPNGFGRRLRPNARAAVVVFGALATGSRCRNVALVCRDAVVAASRLAALVVAVAARLVSAARAKLSLFFKAASAGVYVVAGVVVSSAAPQIADVKGCAKRSSGGVIDGSVAVGLFSRYVVRLKSAVRCAPNDVVAVRVLVVTRRSVLVSSERAAGSVARTRSSPPVKLRFAVVTRARH